MSLQWLHAPRVIKPDVLDLCRQAAKIRYEYHSDKPWYKGMAVDGYLYGCLGEALVSELSGHPWDVSFSGGDEGTDFLDTDAKAVPVNEVDEFGMLRRLAASKKWAPWYTLCVVTRDLSAYRFCGYASGTMLSKAPTREWGWGPTHFLMERTLLPGLPPPLTKKGAA